MSVDTSETSFADWCARQDASLAARGLTRVAEMSNKDEAILRDLMGDAVADKIRAEERAVKGGAPAAKPCPLRAQPIPGLRCTCRACTAAAKGGA